MRYQAQVDRWAREVIAQLAPPKTDLSIAVEDLVIEGRALGLDGASDRLEALLEALFVPAPSSVDPDGRSGEWKKLIALAGEEGGRAAKRSDLQAFVLAAASASQGAIGQPIACDATAILPGIKQAIRTWEPGDTDPSIGKKFQAHHGSLRDRLPGAIDRERERLLEWAGSLERSLGSASVADVASAILETANAAVTAGIFRPVGRDQELRHAVEKAVEFAEIVDNAPALVTELAGAKPGKALALIAEDREEAMAATAALIAESERFLRETAMAVERDITAQGSGGVGGDRAQAVLDALEALDFHLATASALRGHTARQTA